MISAVLSSPRLVMFLLGWIAFTIVLFVLFVLILSKLNRLDAKPEMDEADGAPEGDMSAFYFDPKKDRGYGE